jgi:hypothetical protein
MVPFGANGQRRGGLSGLRRSGGESAAQTWKFGLNPPKIVSDQPRSA